MQALKGVVIIMTLTIAVLMTLIVYGMYQKSQNPDFKFFDLGGGDKTAASTPTTMPTTMPTTIPDAGTAAGADAQASGRAFGDIALPLPPGARITSATVAGDRLVVVVNAEQVWVVDLSSGQVLGRVKAQGAP